MDGGGICGQKSIGLETGSETGWEGRGEYIAVGLKFLPTSIFLTLQEKQKNNHNQKQTYLCVKQNA